MRGWRIVKIWQSLVGWFLGPQSPAVAPVEAEAPALEEVAPVSSAVEAAATDHQPSLFSGIDGSDAKAEVSIPVDPEAMLDDLFLATRAYYQSDRFAELLAYIRNFREYSTFNCFLVRLQRPEAGYVATPKDWAVKFGRWVKPDARPLVMLRPFGPVMFVFDLADTDGQPAPKELMDPFVAEGPFDRRVWERTLKNCALDHIRVDGLSMSRNHAGSASLLSNAVGKIPAEFAITYNSNQDLAARYVTLAHELAHIYCGHLGWSGKRDERDRGNLPKNVCEFEAESVAYIVASRKGLITTGPEYLAHYTVGGEIPPIDVYRVLTVANRIEEMGEKVKKPGTKASRKATVPKKRTGREGGKK